LITGLALLISSAVQLNSGLSSYHWQMTIYLVWFSSFTHLATLTMLRKYFKDNSVLKWTRLFAMSVLIGLLIFALVPTGSRLWLEGGYSLGATAINAGVPALCFLRFQVPGSHFGGEQGSSVIFSVMILFFSFATRVVKMFSWSSQKARSGFRTNLGNTAKSFQKNLFESMQKRSKLRWLCFIPYWSLLSLVIVARACLDSFESMIWEVSCCAITSFSGPPQLTYPSRLFGSYSLCSGAPFDSLVQEIRLYPRRMCSVLDNVFPSQC
jgi:hypothetical protein